MWVLALGRSVYMHNKALYKTGVSNGTTCSLRLYTHGIGAGIFNGNVGVVSGRPPGAFAPITSMFHVPHRAHQLCQRRYTTDAADVDGFHGADIFGVVLLEETRAIPGLLRLKLAESLDGKMSTHTTFLREKYAETGGKHSSPQVKLVDGFACVASC
jgi:hypothetical protein